MTEKQQKSFTGFMKRYSLVSYKNKNKPAIFYSLWGIRSLLKHNSLAIIIWRGSDIIKMRNKLKIIKKKKNVYHIAISSFIMNDLNSVGIPYVFIPLVGADVEDFKPAPLGDEIYTYVPFNSNKHNIRYNLEMITKIKKKCKYKINIIKKQQYSRKKLIKLYKRCFCGLRLTKHDGLPNQVIEMGLMGRRSFYNGDIPTSIKWSNNNVNQIIENIDEESKKIGTIDNRVVLKIKKYINVGEQWLKINYWI